MLGGVGGYHELRGGEGNGGGALGGVMVIKGFNRERDTAWYLIGSLSERIGVRWVRCLISSVFDKYSIGQVHYLIDSVTNRFSI